MKFKARSLRVGLNIKGYRIEGSGSNGFTVLCWGALELQGHRLLWVLGSRIVCYWSLYHALRSSEDPYVFLSLLHDHLYMDDRIFRACRKG